MGWQRTAHGNVIVLADGMGGQRGGALAAQLVVESLLKELATVRPDETSSRARVMQAFEAANTAVFSTRSADDPETRSMGSTGVAVVTVDSRAVIGHVGDSRAYLWHPDKGLRQLTKDHSIVQKMVDAGLLTPEQATTHPEASMLERALGHQPEVEADVSSWLQLEQGDTLMVCSDGLCGYASDSEIAQAFEPGGRPQEITDRLVDLALSKGGGDNVTVQVLRLGEDASMSTSKLMIACAATAVISVSLSAGWSTWLYSRVAGLTPTAQQSVVATKELTTKLDDIARKIANLDQTVASLAARPTEPPPVTSVNPSPPTRNHPTVAAKGAPQKPPATDLKKSLNQVERPVDKPVDKPVEKPIDKPPESRPQETKPTEAAKPAEQPASPVTPVNQTPNPPVPRVPPAEG
jgi:serine/threonine protein phosphatase PrpC